jgi:hypothetical protein
LLGAATPVAFMGSVINKRRATGVDDKDYERIWRSAPMSRLEAGGPEEHEGHSTFMPFMNVDGTTLFTDCARLASQ